MNLAIIKVSETSILYQDGTNFKENKRALGNKRIDVTVRNLYELNRTRGIQNCHLAEGMWHKCSK